MIQIAMALLDKNLKDQFNLTLISLTGTGFYLRHQGTSSAAGCHNLSTHKGFFSHQKLKITPNFAKDKASKSQWESSKLDSAFPPTQETLASVDVSGHARISYSYVPQSGILSKRKERELREERYFSRKAVKVHSDSNEGRATSDWASAILKMASNVVADTVCVMPEQGQPFSANFSHSPKIEGKLVKREISTQSLTEFGAEARKNSASVQLSKPQRPGAVKLQDLDVTGDCGLGKMNLLFKSNRVRQGHGFSSSHNPNEPNSIPMSSISKRAYECTPSQNRRSQLSKNVRGPMDAFVLRKM